MKQLAIIFYGSEYSYERPIFYYTAKLLRQKDYEVCEVKYGDYNEEMELNIKTKKDLLNIVLSGVNQCRISLTGVDFSSYDRVVFVSKAIGTMVANVLAGQIKMKPAYVMFTPVEQVFQLIEDYKGIVFAGAKDELINYHNIQNLCVEKSVHLYTVEQGNHFLETEDTIKDIENHRVIMNQIDRYLENLDKSVFDFKVLNRDNTTKSLSDYRGEVLLIVNTATGCGLTPQYEFLENLHKKYHKEGFEVLDFPCNQFANQAPGTAKEIHSFCTSRYNITFPQFAKINVNGDNQLELYAYLKSMKGFQGFDTNSKEAMHLAKTVEAMDPDYAKNSNIKWNFTKFLVNREGMVVKRYEPMSGMEEIEKDIRELL